MKAFISLTALCSVAVVVAVFAFINLSTDPLNQSVTLTSPDTETSPGDVAGVATENPEDTQKPNEPENVLPLPAEFGLPMSRALDRVTKKPFGLQITPATSPVEGDRFSGYHVGVDFETFADEQEASIAIIAICDGPLVLKKQASGYGGVAVQACKLNGADVTVIYGHLALASIKINTGQELKRGQQVGILGQGYSEETDGVRKHLHLGIHQGSALDIRGYVQTEEETNAWLDAQEYLK